MITVVYISEGKILGVKVDEKKLIIKDSFELGWDVNTLDISMGQMVEKLKSKKIRLLLDDKYSYVLRVNIPANLHDNEERKIVAEKIKEKIPEVLQDKDWDYKEIQFNISENKVVSSIKEREVIVFSPVKYLTDLISKAVTALQLDVEAIEPVEIASTRHANPIIGLALKNDINGDDKKVLNISLEKTSKEEDFKDIITSETTTEPSRSDAEEKGEKTGDTDDKKPVKKGIILAILTLTILVFMSYLGYLIYRDFFLNKKDDESKITVTPTPTVALPENTPSPAEEEVVDISQYKIMIRNGSGVAGEAQNAVRLLEGFDFEQITTGNANSYDYTLTQISVSLGVPVEVSEELTAALEQEYLVASESSTLQDSEFDIEVIVGTKK